MTTSEPRAIIRHFAAAMERKLAANDAIKGGWRYSGKQTSNRTVQATHARELWHAMKIEQQEMLEALSNYYLGLATPEDVLMEAADVSNYLAMICDACGALPPTDERGR